MEQKIIDYKIISAFNQMEIEHQLMNIYSQIGIDKPINHNDIIDYIENDIMDTRDVNDYTFTSEDVKIGFRRFLESLTN